jgi:pyruvate dehydrogenase E2 component (dihydrolipoamide acetyltransferase)
MSQFVMPSLGADMEDGVLVEHLIEQGDPVARGDVIAAVETQKGVIEIEAFEDGILDKWLVPLGTTVPVGTPIAIIRGSGDPSEEPEMPQPTDPATAPGPGEAPQPVDPQSEPTVPEDPQPAPNVDPHSPDELNTKKRQRITPAARRHAAQIGIDLAQLSEGESEIISLKDLAVTPTPPASASLSAMRQAISAAMTRSKREIPHYYLSDTIDLTTAEDFITTRNADLPPDARLVLGVLYVRAVALAAQSFPEFNGVFENGQFIPSPSVHVGMAIKLRSGGLVAPALHDAQTEDIDALMAKLRDLVTRVRQGRFRARELSDPTITLTSLGDRGVAQITGVIYPPQVAIVGIGTPRLRPAIIDGQIVARKIATITLAADHRVSDGHRGAQFLRAIIAHLQNPEAL